MATDSARVFGGATSPTEWATRLDVFSLLVDYQAALDGKRFLDAASCFAEDGVLEVGGTRLTGPAEIGPAVTAQLGTLDLTHHTAGNARVDALEPDGSGRRAHLSAEAVGAHLWTEGGQAKQCVQGGHYEAELRLTPQGWRFTRLAPTFLWTVGDEWLH